MADPTQYGTLGATVRSPNIRDSSTIVALVKSMRTNPGSIMDIAPLLRLSLISLALDEHLNGRDITPTQFVRNGLAVGDCHTHIIPRPPDLIPNGNLIAMAFDVFITFMNNGIYDNEFVLPMFSPANVDITWTAIPMRSAMLNNVEVWPYIMAFLDSRYTAGSVNVHHLMQYRDTVNDQNFSAHAMDEMITMPAANTVRVPGCINAIIVLTDVTSSSFNLDHVHLNGVEINVFTGNAAMHALDFRQEFMQWWHQDNLPRIRQSVIVAHREITTRLTTFNTASLALSLAAEMHLTLRLGLGIRTNPDDIMADYDMAFPVCGSTLLGAPGSSPPNSALTAPLYRGSPFISEIQSYDRWISEQYVEWAEDMYAGFNQSSLSCFHLTPTGCAGLVNIPDEGAPNWNSGQYYINWDTEQSTPGYHITSSSSLSRVAIHIGLIETHQDSLRFNTAGSLPAWLHMLSVAHSANAAAMLVTNNLSVAYWSGTRTNNDDMYGTALIAEAKQTLFSGYVNHTRIYEVAGLNAWPYYLDRSCEEFYHIPTTQENFLTHSPVPIHFVLQWVKKLAIGNFPSIPERKWFRFREHNTEGIPIRRDTAMSKLSMFSTIDFVRYRPRVLVRSYFEAIYYAWVEMFSFLSMHYSGAAGLTKREFLESQTLTITPAVVNLPFVEDSVIYVLNSSSMLKSDATENISVNDILYPDPPTFEQAARFAKNYILGPATAGLMGMLAAGPPGAVIGATADVGQQILKDLIGSREERAKQEKDEELAQLRAQMAAMSRATEPVNSTQQTAALAPTQAAPSSEGPVND